MTLDRAAPRLKEACTKSRFEPRLVICSWMVASVPALMATMMMTAATPIMMPSMVRKERILFFRIASQAIRMASDGFMGVLLFCGLVVFLAVVNNGVYQPVYEVNGSLGMSGNRWVMRNHDDGGALGV